jgi:hypothetical protein
MRKRIWNEYERMDGEAHPQTRRIVRSTPCEQVTQLQEGQKSEVEVCETGKNIPNMHQEMTSKLENGKQLLSHTITDPPPCFTVRT